MLAITVSNGRTPKRGESELRRLRLAQARLPMFPKNETTWYEVLEDYKSRIKYSSEIGGAFNEQWHGGYLVHSGATRTATATSSISTGTAASGTRTSTGSTTTGIAIAGSRVSATVFISPALIGREFALYYGAILRAFSQSPLVVLKAQYTYCYQVPYIPKLLGERTSAHQTL